MRDDVVMKENAFRKRGDGFELAVLMRTCAGVNLMEARPLMTTSEVKALTLHELTAGLTSPRSVNHPRYVYVNGERKKEFIVHSVMHDGELIDDAPAL